ncbi:hypothetical protein JCM1840_002229 [Sporobolomyces johnsonii]
MSAYIPTLELEQLSLSPVSSAMSSLPTSSCSSFPSTSASSTGSASSPPKQVSFCPLALLIGVAGEGEVEMPMAQAAQRDLGRLGLEAPNLGNATSRAWHSVVNGFSASLEPLLSSNSGSRGVVSRSRSRESSPERERERSRSRSPRRDYVSDEDDDPTFIPSSPTRLNIKLPTIRRKTSRTCLVPLCSKPILRNSPSPARAFNTLALPAVSSSSDALSTSPRSSSSCTPRSLPSLARTESHPPMPALHPEAGLIVPLAPCCTTCSRGTEYGLSASDAEYIERWTWGALRLREEQAKERREKEEWERQAEGIRRAYAAKRGEEDEKEEEEEEEELERELEGSKLARKAVVDELQLERDKRGIKTTQERDEDQAPVLSLAFEPAATTVGLESTSMFDFAAAAVMTEEPESLDLDEPADETATPTPSSPTFPSVAPTPRPAAPTTSHSDPVPRPLPFPSSAAPLRSSPDKSTERPSQPAPPPPKRRLFSGFGTANTSLFFQSSSALATAESGAATATATASVP